MVTEVPGKSHCSISFQLLHLLSNCVPRLITGCLDGVHRCSRYIEATASHKSFYKLPFLNTLQGQQVMDVSDFPESVNCLLIPVLQSDCCWIFTWSIYLTAVKGNFTPNYPQGKFLWRSQQTFKSSITNVAGDLPWLVQHPGRDDSDGSSSLSHTDSPWFVLEMATFSSL